MKKGLLSLGIIAMAAAVAAAAEPLTLEKADNVLDPRVLEIGLSDVSWQSDTVEYEGTGISETNTGFSVPLYARYAATPKIEAFALIPYSSYSPDGGDSISGLADPVIGGKYTVSEDLFGRGWKLGAAGVFGIPAGSDDLRRGFNIKPLLAARREFGPWDLDLNLAYTITGKRDDMEFQDELTLGASVARPVTLAGLDLSLIGEAVYTGLTGSATYLTVQQNGSRLPEVKDETGSRIDLLLGARYNTGNWKTKLGFDLSLGKEDYRSYDYRIIAGVTYLVK